MKNANLIAIFVSLVLGIIAYFTSNNYYLAGSVPVIFLFYYLLIGSRKIKQYLSTNFRIHSCYHFINSFLINMSVKDSLDDSYFNATQGASGEYLDIVNELNNMPTMDKIEYLRKYFNLAVYKMFINVLNIYLDQGGRLLTMGEALLQETTRIEDTLNKSNRSIKKIAIEFGVLWLITFGVLVFLRFGVQEFYLTMLTSIPFFVTLCLFFVLFILSVHIFILRATNIYIKGDRLDV